MATTTHFLDLSIRFASRLGVALVLCVNLVAPAGLIASEQPNIVLIMADDLGFSDVGAYGGEIKTPHLDQLAADGLQFTNFYNTGRCWPTRGALLTGYYPHQIRRDSIPGVPSGGRGKRPAWAPLLPRRLAPLGYRSYHSGKWHIDGMPVAEGFDRSYYLQDQGRFFYPKVHYLDDKKLPAVEPNSGFYGTTAIADRAIEFLKQHAEQHKSKPFFHYVAFTAPHFPLHALPDDIAKYEGAYERDWETVRQERYRRQKQARIVNTDLSKVERNLGPPYDFLDALEKLGPGEVNRPLPWKQLSPEQQKFQATKMSLHAAMVDRIDQEVGRIIQQLKKMDAWENTLILFLSDNGASAEIMVRTDGHDRKAAPGSGASYLCLGPGWSTTCNTPFRRHKTWVHEGGIATPLIAHWPQGITEKGLCHSPGHVIDVAPTIVALCKANSDTGDREIVGGLSTEGQRLGPRWPGRDLSQLLASPASKQSERALWWLHEGNRAIRVGAMKLVAAKGEPWALYDLSTDRAESTDLVAERPDQVTRLSKQWEDAHRDYIRDAKADLNKPTR